MSTPKNKSGRIRTLLILLAVIIFLVTGTLLTREQAPASPVLSRAAGKTVTYSTKEAPAAAESVMMFTADAGEITEDTAAESENGDAARGDKLIRTASVSIRTTAFDTVLAAARRMAAEAGGRVESLSVYGDADEQNRWGYLTIRVPSDKLDDFLATAEGLGQVTGYSENTLDVSDTYYDLQSRLALQQAKLEKLQAMLPQATTVSEIV